MTPGTEDEGPELTRLPDEAAAHAVEIRGAADRELALDALIARLRREAEVHDAELADLGERLKKAELELHGLRAIRDALTPPELPQRPGMELAASFLPAIAEQVSGDFYLVAQGPRDSTLLVIGDVIGHGLSAARRAAFVRTTFAATAPFSDDPAQLLSWGNTALVERAGPGSSFVTVACLTYAPEERHLRYAYAGHPPAVWMPEGSELAAPAQGPPLGIEVQPEYVAGQTTSERNKGLLLYTDGLTEARHGDNRFGLEGVIAALREVESPSPREALAILHTRVADFAYGTLTDDVCMLAVRIE